MKRHLQVFGNLLPAIFPVAASLAGWAAGARRFCFAFECCDPHGVRPPRRECRAFARARRAHPHPAVPSLSFQLWAL